jgi:hypothetical protein
MQESNIILNNRQQSVNSKTIISEFAKPIFLNRFYTNLDGLVYNSRKIEFNKNKWIQNPQQFCLDHYRNHNYYKIILLVNSISSIFDFDRYNFKDGLILAPSETSIINTLM